MGLVIANQTSLFVKTSPGARLTVSSDDCRQFYHTQTDSLWL